MKKLFLAALAFAMCGFFASCWHSEEKPINDWLSTYTVKESGYIGLKKTGAPAGENLTDAIYVSADDYNGFVLAQCKRDNDGVSRWAILDPKTAKPISNLRFEKVWIGQGFFTMLAKDQKYFFAGSEIYGPKADLAYYPNKSMLFTKSDGKWGCDDEVPESYNRLLYLTDGTDARFVGVDGKKAVLMDTSGKIIKKNIPASAVSKLEENNKKAWDYQYEVGVLVVKNIKTAI